jgi:peptidyl-prolyl cis-trans isomerase A (cyclophilin A)
MLRNLRLALLLTILPVLVAAAQEKKPHVVFHTQLGDIELELDPAHAPATVANFLRYVNGGFYDGGAFSRTVTMDNQPNDQIKIEVIQANISPARKAESFPAIPIETTNVTGLHHLNGTISMGRNAAKDGNTSEIFICIGDQPELDFAGKRNPDGQGFAAFGQVVHGMDVVKKIQMSPAEKQRLVPAVGIVSAAVMKDGAKSK